MWLRGSGWYIRFYKDGKQRAEFLCPKDDKHHSASCKAVKTLQAERMQKINSESEPLGDSTTVRQFWDRFYYPWVEKNLRASTAANYLDLYIRNLAPHFGETKLAEYRSVHATRWLSSLGDTMNRTSINHLRSLMSGLFSYACAIGQLETNPIREAKILGKTKPAGKTQHFTLEELENATSALVDDPAAQCVVGLAGFLGFRPSEICGLRWEDVSQDAIHIRRAFTKGALGPTKTPESVASLPLIAPVRIPLGIWHEKSGSPSEGWVFPNRAGNPIDIQDFVQKRIRPILAAKGIPWRTLYGGRRGCATILTQLTGNPIAASQVLRHRNIAVTMQAYIKNDRRAMVEGLKLLEEKATK